MRVMVFRGLHGLGLGVYTAVRFMETIMSRDLPRLPKGSNKN